MSPVTSRHLIQAMLPALTTLVSACGPPVVAEPVARPTVEPPPDEGPPSLLADEEAPLVVDRPDRPPSAHGEPVFQNVHRRPVAGLAFSPDGRAVAAVSDDGAVSVIDARTGEVRAAWRVWVRTNDARTVDFDRTGTRLLVANSEGYQDVADYYVWDLHTGHWLAPATNDIAVRAVAIDPTGRTVARVGDDPVGAPVLVLGAVGGGHERVVPLSGEGGGEQFRAAGLRFSPGGQRVLLFDEQSGAVQIRDVETGEITGSLAGETYDLTQVEARPTGGAIATLGSDGRVRIHHPYSGRELRTLVLPSGQVPRLIEWTPAGERLVVWGESGDLMVFDGATGAPLTVFPLPGDPEQLLHHAWSPAGGPLYTVDVQGRIRRWVGDDGEAAGELTVADRLGNADIAAIALSPDGGTLAVAAGADVVLIAVSESRILGRAAGGAGEHSIWGASWAPDSRSLVTWGRPGVEVWGAAGARSVGCPGVGNVTWAPDGSGRYFQSDGLSGTRVCDLSTGAVREVQGLVTLSEDGSIYVTADEHTVRLHDATTGNLRRTIRLAAGERAFQVSLSADGRLAALGRDREVRIIDERGRSRARVRGTDTVRSYELSPDGRSIMIRYQRSGGLYSGVDGRPLLLYEAPGDARYPRIPHAFAPDGSAFAYAVGRDVSIVEPGSGRVVSTVQAADDPRELRFSQDGSSLLVVTPNRITSLVAPDGDPLGEVELFPVDTYDVSADGRTVVVCSGGLIRMVTMVTGRAVELGSCAPLSQGPLLSPDGRLVAIRNSALVRVLRVADGEELTLRTLRLGGGARLLAYDGRGAFWAEDATVADLRYRAAGRMTTAELTPVTAAHPRRSDLVQSFFGR